MRLLPSALYVVVTCVAISNGIVIETVLVDNPGNFPDVTGFGDVAYEYRISAYQITNVRYTEFLNAVAKDDPNELFNATMSLDENVGGIVRIGFPSDYSYVAKPEKEDTPVVFVSYYDALRFANWLHNGQPVGPQGPITTEDGAYTFSDPMTVDSGRNTGAIWFLPTENEWYKASYHQPFDEGGDLDDYWLYRAQSNTHNFLGQPSYYGMFAPGVGSTAIGRYDWLENETPGHPKVRSFRESTDSAGFPPDRKIKDISFHIASVMFGDLNNDALCDAEDIDALRIAITDGSADLVFDLNRDGTLDSSDWNHMIHVVRETEFGDVNLDQNVDATDLATLRTNFGSIGGWSLGNFTLGDTDIDANDLAKVRTNFGFAPPALTPEPSGILLMVGGLLALRRHRRRLAGIALAARVFVRSTSHEDNQATH